MKKKIAITILVGLGLFLGVSNVLGAVIYERTPSGYFIQNPVSFSASFDSFGETECFTAYWGIAIGEATAPNRENYVGCAASTTQEVVGETDLTLPVYHYVYFSCYESLADCQYCVDNSHTGVACPVQDSTGAWLEYSDLEIIFEFKGPLFEGITTSFATGTLAYVNLMITGLGPWLYMIIGIPLGFWVVRKLIGLIPKK